MGFLAAVPQVHNLEGGGAILPHCDIQLIPADEGLGPQDVKDGPSVHLSICPASLFVFLTTVLFTKFHFFLFIFTKL